MYDIEMQGVSEDFVKCWKAAGQHLQTYDKDVNINWLKSDLIPPFLEHLSFRIGNQLFFVRIVTNDDSIKMPGNDTGYLTISEGCHGNACLMPMEQQGQAWIPIHPGWGIIHPVTNKSIIPVELVTDEKIEITDWELHDFTVQIVRDHVVQKMKFQLMSSQGNPNVDPSIWIVGERGPEWIVVRGVRYPEKEALLPKNIKDIANDCARLSKIGHFASVSLANQEDAFDPSGNIPALPILMGFGANIRFNGLVPLSVH